MEFEVRHIRDLHFGCLKAVIWVFHLREVTSLSGDQ